MDEVVKARSACNADAATMSVAVAELLWVPEAAVAVSLITVPAAVPALTLSITVNVPVAPAATLGLVQLTGGDVQVQPEGAETETNVVLAGVASEKVAAVAAADPTLLTTCV